MSAEKPSGMSVRTDAVTSGGHACRDAPLQGCAPAVVRRMSLVGRFTATGASAIERVPRDAAVADRGAGLGFVDLIRRRCGKRVALGLSAAELGC